jgi:hypothetical protein
MPAYTLDFALQPDHRTALRCHVSERRVGLQGRELATQHAEKTALAKIA